MKNILLSTILAVTLFSSLAGQVAGHVFGIDNPSSGVFWFSKTDVTTGVHTQLQQLPMQFYSSASSSCVDPVQQIFCYSSGTEILKIDPLTGNVLTTVQLPLPANANLYHLQYNPCDSMMYGVVNNYPASIYLAQYNPFTDALTAVGSLPTTLMFCMGCMAVIDPIAQLYVMHDGAHLQGIDIPTGQLLFTTTVVNMSSEIFGHISYDCASGEIVGLSASQNEDVKYLATVDPLTGIVTHVSNLFWYQGWWKPSGGGNCIDFATGTYYYSGAPDLLIGVDLVTGDTVSVHATGQGSFLFVQCFTQCPCSPAGIEETSASAYNVFPNPATDVLTIQTATTGSALQYCTITDVLGQEILRIPVNNPSVTVSVEEFACGVYFWTIWSEDRVEGSGRFVKE